MPTVLTEEQTRQLLNDMTNNHDLSFHVEYLEEVDQSILGAYGTAPGYFWVIRDAYGTTVRIRRIIVMYDGTSSRTASAPSDLDELTLQTSLKAMLKSIYKEKTRTYAEDNLIGPYDVQKMSNLLGI